MGTSKNLWSGKPQNDRQEPAKSVKAGPLSVRDNVLGIDLAGK